MSREFPDFVDPWKAAEGRRAFGGTMPLKRLSRLGELLAPDLAGPDAEFAARFGYDEQGLVVIDVDVRAELPLVCQRSLKPYFERVERHSRLAVIDDIAGEETIPDSYEPVLVEEGRLALADVVEDELLLAIPQIPKSPDTGEVELSTGGVVEAPSRTEKERTYRPFGELGGMMNEAGED